MNDYLAIIQILSQVLSGKNLNEAFANNITAEINNVNKIKDITYGVIRNYYKIKTVLNEFLNSTPSSEQILIILYIGIYEVKYSKKPGYAVTNDLVELSYQITSNDKIKNFVNAVLRNYLRLQDSVEEIVRQKSEYRYNFPIWLISKLKKEYPKKYFEIINYSNLIPKMELRVNLSKISFAEYSNVLEENDCSYSLIENKIILSDSLSVKEIPLFLDGCVSIQDISAQKLIEIAKPNDGDYVLDACSAPGGKTCQILENCKVDLVAMDIDELRLAKVQQNIQRLGLSAKLITGDATNTNWWDNKQFDFIIADVPCTASGTLKRNPDIKLHRQLTDIDKFVKTQRKIVSNLWQTLKPGGKLIYITCSIFKEENHDNIEFFKQELNMIKVVRELNILPTEYADGFYYCVIEKNK